MEWINNVIKKLKRNPLVASITLALLFLVFTIFITAVYNIENRSPIDIKNIALRLGDNNAEIEIFIPSNSAEIISNIELICKQTKTNLLIKPVGLSAGDREESINWVCEQLFNNNNKQSLSIAESIVKGNEKEANLIEPDEKYTTIIILRKNQTSQKFIGWDKKVRKSLVASLTME